MDRRLLEGQPPVQGHEENFDADELSLGPWSNAVIQSISCQFIAQRPTAYVPPMVVPPILANQKICFPTDPSISQHSGAGDKSHVVTVDQWITHNQPARLNKEILDGKAEDKEPETQFEVQAAEASLLKEGNWGHGYFYDPETKEKFPPRKSAKPKQEMGSRKHEQAYGKPVDHKKEKAKKPRKPVHTVTSSAFQPATSRPYIPRFSRKEGEESKPGPEYLN